LSETKTQSAQGYIWKGGSDMPELKVIKTEQKKKSFGQKVKDAWNSTKEYIRDNPEQAIAIATVAAAGIGGATKLVNSVNRHKQIRQEQFRRDRQVYDRSMGRYLTTNRKLTKTDYDRVNAYRRRTGKRTGEALSDLGLLER
jgi:putative protein kinase ArgK-like GTPase of G3E family